MEKESLKEKNASPPPEENTDAEDFKDDQAQGSSPSADDKPEISDN